MIVSLQNMRKINSFFEIKLTFGLGFLLILAGCGSMGSKKHWRKVDAKLLSGSDQQHVKPFRVSFYNLENLFDTVDGPNDDAEFLPTSANAWNGERYKSKLRNMAQVIDSIAPDILGLVELENAFVLEDLRANSSVMKGRFEIAHRESPDLRGIDVALMYNAELFRISGIYMTSIALPDGYATRSIMRVHLVEKGTGDSLAVFVNHWPSRRGGAPVRQAAWPPPPPYHKPCKTTQPFQPIFLSWATLTMIQKILPLQKDFKRVMPFIPL